MQAEQLRLWNKSRQDFLVEVSRRLKNKPSEKIWVATVNPEFVVEAWRDPAFMEILQTCTAYNVVDGNALLLATGLKQKSLITGVDLMKDLCEVAERDGYGINFVGGWEDEAQKTAEYFLKIYPKLKVNLALPPEKIRGESWKNNRPSMTFVALGMKKQELWIKNNWNILPTGLIMGVGRSFDYYSGKIKRAPKWLRRLKLEWLYSALMDPKRAKRQLKNLPVFVIRGMLGLGNGTGQ